MNVSKKFGCFFLCFCCLFFTGCWDSNEINEIAIVSAVALDKSDDGQLSMSLLISNPGKLSGSGAGASSAQEPNSNQATILLSDKGEGILDIYHNIQSKLPKQIYFSHLRVIVISEELARDGIADVVDFFTRFRESHLRTEVVFTKGKAVDLFKIDTDYEKFPSESIRKKTQLVVGTKSTLLSFISNIAEDGVEASAPEFETGPYEIDNHSSDQKKAVVYTGTAVFKNDQLLGFLNDQKMKGVVDLSGKTNGGTITIHIPEDRGGGFVAMRIPSSKTKITPLLSENGLEANLTVKIEARIFENESRLDLSKPESLSLIEDLAKATLNDEIRSLLEQVTKTYHSDIYGFGAAFHRKYRTKWETDYQKQWDTLFSNLKINIYCNVTVKRIGFLTNSLGIQKSELVN